MLNVSLKVKYGLSALLYMSQYGGNEPIQTKKIASNCEIPQQFLEQVLVILKKAELVKSFRGSNGGYVINKPLEDIMVYDIIRILEGEKCFTDGYSGCNALKEFWLNVSEDLKALFKVSLKVLLENKQKMEKMLDYHI